MTRRRSAEEKNAHAGFAKHRDRRPATQGGRQNPCAFDGKRAMGYLEAVCKIGPRISGTEGMKKQQDLIKKHFEDLGAKVTFQKFTASQNSAARKPSRWPTSSSRYHPEKKRRVILCSHYDTRPIADQEPDPRNWRQAVRQRQRRRLRRRPAHGAGQPHEGSEDQRRRRFRLLRRRGVHLRPRPRRRTSSARSTSPQTWRKKKDRRDYVGGHPARHDRRQERAASRSRATRGCGPGSCADEVWGIASELKCHGFVSEVRRTTSRTTTSRC